MVSSARNAPSPTVVIAGSASTVDASTRRPTRMPSARSHTGVNRLAYNGNSPTRAMLISRSVVHACQAIRPCTGWWPARRPMLMARTRISTSSAYVAR